MAKRKPNIVTSDLADTIRHMSDVLSEMCDQLDFISNEKAYSKAYGKPADRCIELHAIVLAARIVADSIQDDCLM